jgi:hypothetical protein
VDASGGELQATFVVRLRREPGTPAGEWRGEVEHVQSASLTRFADRDALLAFVSARLAEAERRHGEAGGASEISPSAER